jgi:cell division septal protein FtsQ
VLLVDTHAVEVKLEALPWVERATVETDFPHTVYIDIREQRGQRPGADGQFG